jgi:hypothetical protein
MYLPFDQLPTTSRTWVYTTARLLSKNEVERVLEKIKSFLETWQSHQMDMKASFLVVENRFIVVAADESYNDVSGCGIDKSTHVLQELEKELGTSLTDKSLVIFEKHGEQIALPFQKIREEVAKGTIDSETIFFNVLAENVGQFQTQFKLKSTEGWVKKYFNPVAI